MLRVKNLEKYQHYSKRRPPWIKLHRSVLDDYYFRRLPDAAKAHAMLIWLIASGCDNALHDDAQWLAEMVGANTPVDIDGLVSAGFLERYDSDKRKRGASKPKASRQQNGGTEGEGEGEGEGEKRQKLPLPAVAKSATSAEGEGASPAPRVTWLTPAEQVWEARYGPGSFDLGQAMRELAKLYRKGNGLTPDEIARRLAWYLENKGSETVLPPEQLARRHFTPSLRDFRLRHGAFDPSQEVEV